MGVVTMAFGRWDPFRAIHALLKSINMMFYGVRERLASHSANPMYISTERDYKFEFAPWGRNQKQLILSPVESKYSCDHGRSQPQSQLRADIHHQAVRRYIPWSE